MAKKGKGKKSKSRAKVRGFSPPTEGSAPRGKTMAEATDAQNSAYAEIVGKVKEKSYTGRGYWLRLHHMIGHHAELVIQGKDTYGARQRGGIAADFDCQRLTLSQSILFYKNIDAATLNRLCEMEPPPSWRMMAKWAQINPRDGNAGAAAKQKAALEDILGGKLKADGFDESLRKLLGRGPKQPRRPVGPVGTFQKISAEATTMTQHLTWIDRADAELKAMSDAAAQRDARTLIRASLKDLKGLQSKLSAAIKRCESLI